MPDLPLSRRRLLDWFLGTSVAALLGSILYPVLRFLTPVQTSEAATREVEGGSANDPELLAKGFRILRFGAEPVVLLRVSPRDFRAFSATCTHLDCIVEYQPRNNRIFCNCHSGVYDLEGRNIAGPPPRPLQRFEVHRVPGGGGADTLVVSRG